jgi:hypothetical protein
MEGINENSQFELSSLLGNWRAFTLLLETFCIAMGGAAGLQILQSKKIPLRPFSSLPGKNDFEPNASGSLNKFTYENVDYTDEITPAETFDLQLTAAGKSELRKDQAIYEAALTTRIGVDNKLLQFLYKDMSKDAMSVPGILCTRRRIS